jgi:malyl-CoA/(S)-citramalyl-CoA lyase
MKLPRNFFKPLAIGAPAPLRDLPLRLERMIHFVPPHIEKVRARVPELVHQVDVVLGNLEDAIPADAKAAARNGFIAMAKSCDFGETGLWTRINALNSPWVLDDITEIVAAIGDKLDVIMLPKVEGAWDIHYLDQFLAQLEAKHGIKKPILIHAILETAEGVNNVADIASASPRPRRARRPTRRAQPFSRICGTTRSPKWSMPAPRPELKLFMARSAISPTGPPARRNSATRF